MRACIPLHKYVALFLQRLDTSAEERTAAHISAASPHLIFWEFRDVVTDVVESQTVVSVTEPR